MSPRSSREYRILGSTSRLAGTRGATPPTTTIPSAEGGGAQPLGLDLTRAALGIVNVVNSNMMHALRYMSTERGRDPRDYALVPFGGAGPIHGAALARALEMRRMIVLPIPGCTSALG